MISHFKASIFHPSDPRITGCSHVRSRIQFWAHIEMLKHQLRGVSAKRFKSTIVSTYAPNWWRQWHFAELFTSHSNSFGESDPLLFWNIQQGGTIELSYSPSTTLLHWLFLTPSALSAYVVYGWLYGLYKIYLFLWAITITKITFHP